ncbi:MAG: cadmium-translocating P-type ATPase [Bacilli bacterium]|nr:cadmium-translocating P-type ATPase [Bacilli bacterium]
MSKKVVYHISGFDCPNCAAKTERHLQKDENIFECSIDFPNDRLYINYKDNPYTIDELKAKIKEVESDPIRVERINSGERKEVKILTKDFVFNLVRVILAVSFFVVGFIFEHLKGDAWWQGEFNWLSNSLYLVAAAIMLYDIVWKVIMNIVHLRNPIDMSLLLTISCVGVIVLAMLTNLPKDNPILIAPEGFPIEMHEGAMVIILYQIGELIEAFASGKSKVAISKAIDLRADTANLVTDNKVVQVKPEELKVGDIIIVRVGEIVPADGEIIEGQGSLDMSSLTGEPLPVDTTIGNNVLSGSILRSGSLSIKVNKVFAESTISKILELVQSSGERKAKTEKIIDKFARFYTPIVFGIGIVFTLIYGLVTKEWTRALFSGLSILIVSCPCAIVISVPLAYFAGIGLASKNGVVIKGAIYIDSLAKLGTVFLDKTGTLTYGNFAVTEIVPMGVSKEEFQEALLAAESRSNHPIAKAITLHQKVSEIALEQEDYEEIAGLGVMTNYKGNVILAGNASLLELNDVKVEEIETAGTVIYVAKNGKYIGFIVIQDVIREKAKKLISKLDDLGVKTVLLSGDKLRTVEYVAGQVGIREYHAHLLPQDKTKFVEDAITHRVDKKTIGFAGDGINDTPSIIRADVGFAMGGIGSDVAVENSDVVIMQDHPLKIYDSIKIARLTRFIAIFNIVFSLVVKLSVLILIMIGVVGQYSMLLAMLADTGLTVLMVLHSLSLIYRKVK